RNPCPGSDVIETLRLSRQQLPTFNSFFSYFHYSSEPQIRKIRLFDEKNDTIHCGLIVKIRRIQCVPRGLHISFALAEIVEDHVHAGSYKVGFKLRIRYPGGAA